MSINLLGPPTGEYGKKKNRTIKICSTAEGKGYLLSMICNKMQGYENVIRMHPSVFLLEPGGGGGVYIASLTANKVPNHGIRAPNPWGGELRYFIWEFLYHIITKFTTRPRDFRHHIDVYAFTQGRGIKPQYFWGFF